jgi:hypothetical protein
VTVAELALVQGRRCSGDTNAGGYWTRHLPQGNRIADKSHTWRHRATPTDHALNDVA